MMVGTLLSTLANVCVQFPSPSYVSDPTLAYRLTWPSRLYGSCAVYLACQRYIWRFDQAGRGTVLPRLLRAFDHFFGNLKHLLSILLADQLRGERIEFQALDD